MADEKGKPPTPPTSGPSGDDAPPPKPSGGPPPPPKPSSSGSGGGKSDNTVMLILSYLWLLALIPLLTEKDDAEVQWHAKHGLVLLVAEVILWVVLGILSMIPFLGCVIMIIWLVAGLGILVLHIMAMVKATKGERLIIPYVSEYTDKF